MGQGWFNAYQVDIKEKVKATKYWEKDWSDGLKKTLKL